MGEEPSGRYRPRCAGGVVFGICGATIPEVYAAPVDPKQVSDSEWFKLAKDTGIVYVSFLIPVVILAAYGAFLRAGGQLLVSILMLILPPSSHKSQYRLLTPSELEPIALTLGKSDSHLADLQIKSSEFALKYQSQKNGRWNDFQQSIGKLSKNVQVYLGDFLLFLIGWSVLFRLLPQASWIQANEARFWPVVLLLSALACFAWFRVSRAIAVVPSLLLMYVSTMIRADPDIRVVLDVSEQKRENVRRRLEELLREAQDHADSRPSLLGFVRYKVGFRRRAPKAEAAKQTRGLPFPSLYEDGYRTTMTALLEVLVGM